jgi:hypothetical protein
MEFVGNLTKDAVLRKSKSDDEFLSFSVAINEKYYSKGQWKEAVTFVKCSFKASPNLLPYLLEGTEVFIRGHLLPAGGYISKGIAMGENRFFVEKLKLLVGSPRSRVQRVAESLVEATVGAPMDNVDDLPF